MDPAAPKLDFKMLVLPAMFLVSKKVDFTNEDTVKLLQGALVAISVVILTVHFFVFSQVSSKKDADKKIWVPPKPKPELPFGLGPPKEPLKPEDFEATTYKDYEIKLLKESAQSIAMSLGISLFMSFKFKVHMSLLMQSVMLPLNLLDVMVLKKYILGTKKGPDGSDKLYGEVFVAPTAESLAAAAPSAPIAGNEPRVEELPDEPKPEAKTETKDKKEDSASTNDIDD